MFSQPPGLSRRSLTGLRHHGGVADARYLFGTAVLSSIFSAVGVLRMTKAGPRGWRLVLMWVSWAATLAIAIGTVADEQKRRELAE